MSVHVDLDSFDLSLIKGIKKSGQRGPFNRRFTEKEVDRIRACWKANGGRRGILLAISKHVGITPSSVWWIVTGMSYKRDMKAES